MLRTLQILAALAGAHVLERRADLYHQVVTMSQSGSRMRAAVIEAPTPAVLTAKLGVPVTTAECEQLQGGGSAGASGARFYRCDCTYGGSQALPTFGLPGTIFVKLRSEQQPLTEFDPEKAMWNFLKYYKDAVRDVPVAPTLWADQDSIMMPPGEPQGDAVWTGDDLKAVVQSYAQVHAAFWGLPENTPGTKPLEWWGVVFTGIEERYDVLDAFYEIAEVPNRDLIRRFRDDIGFENIVAWLGRKGSTLCQGDAHQGQLLKFDGTFKLADWGNSVVASPAVDLGGLLYEQMAKGQPVDQLFQQLVPHYWASLTSKLRELGVTTELTSEDFELHVRMSLLFRAQFLLTIGTPNAEAVQQHFGPSGDGFADLEATKQMAAYVAAPWDQSLFDRLVEEVGFMEVDEAAAQAASAQLLSAFVATVGTWPADGQKFIREEAARDPSGTSIVPVLMEHAAAMEVQLQGHKKQMHRIHDLLLAGLAEKLAEAIEVIGPGETETDAPDVQETAPAAAEPRGSESPSKVKVAVRVDVGPGTGLLELAGVRRASGA